MMSEMTKRSSVVALSMLALLSACDEPAASSGGDGGDGGGTATNTPACEFQLPFQGTTGVLQGQIVDLYGDGSLDWISTAGVPGLLAPIPLYVLTDGPDGFQINHDLPMSGGFTGAFDINGDGIEEVVTWASHFYVYTRAPESEYFVVSTPPYQGGTRRVQTEVSDVNGDGNLDLLVLNAYPSDTDVTYYLLAYLGTSEGGLQDPDLLLTASTKLETSDREPFRPIGSAHAMVTDIEGDGENDVVLTIWGRGEEYQSEIRVRVLHTTYEEAMAMEPRHESTGVFVHTELAATGHNPILDYTGALFHDRSVHTLFAEDVAGGPERDLVQVSNKLASYVVIRYDADLGTFDVANAETHVGSEPDVMHTGLWRPYDANGDGVLDFYTLRSTNAPTEVILSLEVAMNLGTNLDPVWSFSRIAPEHTFSWFDPSDITFSAKGEFAPGPHACGSWVPDYAGGTISASQSLEQPSGAGGRAGNCSIYCEPFMFASDPNGSGCDIDMTDCHVRCMATPPSCASQLYALVECLHSNSIEGLTCVCSTPEDEVSCGPLFQTCDAQENAYEACAGTSLPAKYPIHM